ncbi:unnamed protein product [Protopolystoma xenopodis]|uniref:Uncharacterized protein n=1 Tax=Protopolystoma xenopodis TaxID=117903 RepID=A0A448XGW5_9PLAT|nr:unnamed protein product [Protopolystoma xenopodis]
MMTPLTDDVDYDAGETFGNVPNQWSNGVNHEYYGRGQVTMYVPQGLPDAPTRLRKQDRTLTIKLKETATKKKDTPSWSS